MFRKRDWKEYLPEEIREKVKKAIEETLPYSCAIIQSKDSRIAQLWVAIALLKKELEEKSKLIEIAVKPWKSIVEMGEIEKKRTIEKIVTDLLQPKDKEQKEIVDKLVESLMKF
jgi:uroporphyrinogen-III decarboxylase